MLLAGRDEAVAVLPGLTISREQFLAPLIEGHDRRVMQPANFNEATWIWHAEAGGESPALNAPAGRRFLRRAIILPTDGRPKRAILWIAADNWFVLHVNGKRVSDNVGVRGSRDIADRLDIAEHLVPGENLLAVEVINSPPTSARNPAGFLARLEVGPDAPSGGPPLVLVSDGQWKSSDQAQRVDREIAGWQGPGFDDANWKPAAELEPYGGPSWRNSGVTESRTGSPVRFSAGRQKHSCHRARSSEGTTPLTWLVRQILASPFRLARRTCLPSRWFCPAHGGGGSGSSRAAMERLELAQCDA
jgi:hypothetical protein